MRFCSVLRLKKRSHCNVTMFAMRLKSWYTPTTVVTFDVDRNFSRNFVRMKGIVVSLALAQYANSLSFWMRNVHLIEYAKDTNEFRERNKNRF